MHLCFKPKQWGILKGGEAQLSPFNAKGGFYSPEQYI
jgi:hypothetical protein